jgi:DNA-binding NarL/FixJ family response regulator
MRVLIIEDIPICRLGIKTAIVQENIEVFSADSGLSGMKSIRHSQPDVVIFKLDLPDINGLDLITTIHQEFPTIKIVVISSNSDEGLIKSVFNRGASSYLLPDTKEEILLYAVETAYEGQCWIDPRLSRAMLDIETSPRGKTKVSESLTSMEIKVLKLMALGLSNEKIALKLNVSTGSIRGYTNSLNYKLGSTNRTHAVFLAIFFGYINCKSLFWEFADSENLPSFDS